MQKQPLQILQRLFSFGNYSFALFFHKQFPVFQVLLKICLLEHGNREEEALIALQGSV